MKPLLLLMISAVSAFGATASLAITFTADTNAVTDIQAYLERQVSSVSILSVAMLATDTNLTLSAPPAAGTPTSGTVFIGTELVAYTGITGSQLTGLTRGTTLTNAANNTTAATHAIGSVVQFLTFNAVRAWIVSIVLSNAQAAIRSLGTSSALIGTPETTIGTNQTTENTSLAAAVQ